MLTHAAHLAVSLGVLLPHLSHLGALIHAGAAHVLKPALTPRTPNYVRIFRKAWDVAPVLSKACGLDDNHEGCLGFASLYSDYNNPDDTVPCECICHKHTLRQLDVHGQTYSYTVPDDPAYKDANSEESRALEEQLRQLITTQHESKDQLLNGARITVHSQPAAVDWTQLPTVRIPAVSRPVTLSDDLELPTDANHYQQLSARTRAVAGEDNDALVFCALKMAGEAGETANAICKVVYQGHPLDEEAKHDLLLEIGDVLWCVANTLDVLGYTMDEAMVANRRKVYARYRDNFTPAKSIARVDLEPALNEHVSHAEVAETH